jgi:protein phosphatase
VRTSWGSATDRGRVREVNEDALLTFPPVFLVADGMGGYDAGDLASRIAVEEFAQLAGAVGVGVDDVHACFARASARMRAEFTGGRQGGTTVAGALLVEVEREPYWLVFNVGDSRVYRFSDDGLEQVSVDHSVAQELAEAGVIRPEQVATHPDRHVLTRALGTGEPPEPDYWMLPAGMRDRLLVCTDGLVRELPDDALAAALAARDEPQALADRLVAAALARGGRDNVSVVVVDVVAVAALVGEGCPTAPTGVWG